MTPASFHANSAPNKLVNAGQTLTLGCGGSAFSFEGDPLQDPVKIQNGLDSSTRRLDSQDDVQMENPAGSHQCQSTSIGLAPAGVKS